MFVQVTPVTAEPAARDWIKQRKAKSRSWRALHPAGPWPSLGRSATKHFSTVLPAG